MHVSSGLGVNTVPTGRIIPSSFDSCEETTEEEGEEEEEEESWESVTFDCEEGTDDDRLTVEGMVVDVVLFTDDEVKEEEEILICRRSFFRRGKVDFETGFSFPLPFWIFLVPRLRLILEEDFPLIISIDDSDPDSEDDDADEDEDGDEDVQDSVEESVDDDAVVEGNERFRFFFPLEGDGLLRVVRRKRCTDTINSSLSSLDDDEDDKSFNNVVFRLLFLSPPPLTVVILFFPFTFLFVFGRG